MAGTVQYMMQDRFSICLAASTTARASIGIISREENVEELLHGGLFGQSTHSLSPMNNSNILVRLCKKPRLLTAFLRRSGQR